MRFIILLLFGFSASAQLINNNSLLGGESSKRPFNLGDIITFPAAEARAAGRINGIVTPVILYDSGKTHMVYQIETLGNQMILSYDDRYGISKPIRYHGALALFDGHHKPAIISDNDTLFVPVEKDHGILPISIFKARNPNDELVFELTTKTIGVIPTYPNFSKKEDVFINITQMNDVDIGFNKNSTPYFTGAWSNEAQITTRGTGEDEHYMTCVVNQLVIPDRAAFVATGRDDSPTPHYCWFRKYLIRSHITAGGVTHYNWDESFSKSSQLTAAEMNTNFLYYTTGSATAQGYIPNPAFDDQGNFYDISGDGSGGYDFIYMTAGNLTPTVKAITLPGSPTLLDLQAVPGGDYVAGQNGACMYLLATSPTDVYAIFRQTSGAYVKPFLYKTEDLGDTWTSLGDMLPGIDDDIQSFIMPFNYREIPNNKNFMVIFTGFDDPGFTAIYARKAAFGTVQTETGDPFTDVTAYTESEFHALMVRSYMVEAGKITNTGTTCNSLIDQSPSALDANSTGSPVLDDATTPTYVTLDGTNDAFSIPTTGLTSLTEGTIIAVVDMVDAASGNFLTASKNSVTTEYLNYGKSAADKTRFLDNTVINIEGDDDISDAPHIFIFQHQNNSGTDVLHFLDGALQKRVVTAGTGIEGEFFSSLAGMTNIEVGRLVRTTTNWYNFRLKYVGISDTPFSNDQLRKLCKFLGTKYSITLVNGYD